LMHLMQDTLAKKLRVLRAERGWTLREAAERTGVDKGTLSMLERGIRHPHDITLARLARGYGVPAVELLEEPALAGKAEAPETGPPLPPDYDQRLEHAQRLRDDGLSDEMAMALSGASVRSSEWWKDLSETVGAETQAAVAKTLAEENARLRAENLALREEVERLRRNTERAGVVTRPKA
jgi:transcriptional regulator with XRE-family HTH domain